MYWGYAMINLHSPFYDVGLSHFYLQCPAWVLFVSEIIFNFVMSWVL